jgi:hypothetical protein
METLGYVVAWSQLRSSGRKGSANADALINFAQDNQWHKEVLEYAQNYSQKVNNEYILFILFQAHDMPLSELLPTINQLSHQDKLRLIHFLLLAVAREEGCSLEPVEDIDSESVLLSQLASTEAVVWSPQADREAVQALSDLLVATQEVANA